jgi:catechol 2,3-dioxygenase-like lactoylglutathione lyase family enzyme
MRMFLAVKRLRGSIAPRLLSAACVALGTPNAAGVAMGHLHYRVRDVEANKRFWMALGGKPVDARRLKDDGNIREGRVIDLDRLGRVKVPPAGPEPPGLQTTAAEILSFPDVFVFLEQGESSGGTEGSVVNHVAFRVPSLAAIEAAGLKVQRLQGFPGVASVMSPEGERVELFENAATNLTFTYDAGPANPVSDRHNRPLTLPIAFHHIHLYLPEGAVAAAKAWYVRLFGGVPGKRSNYEAVDLPGINLNLSVGPRPTVATAGRMLDHIGFEIVDLPAFCRRLEGMGITLETPCTTRPDGSASAFLVDPWGTRIELTEGLRRY